MQEKEMISDYLAGLNASLAGYGGIIAQCENEELRSTIKLMRDQDEIRQYALFKVAKEKGYYIPAQQATSTEIATVKQQVSQG
ncbi:spore coat protein [Clostridium sp. NSJ-6]|uniref:Spore coat protein n=1 Tax=Clostridium hominis TaxID=2763036 RepID=A0ABR7D8L9_9CLOT|nr:spore coat protein [Clostridium hominis]MBC5627735.1 spore coat protein [Clostridium hominis]MDU2673007.1 spore coat protein [Clostridium sp.]SCJ10262.1 Coat F domain [uncultured Clostridium sp.]